MPRRLQSPLVTGDNVASAKILRDLAPAYRQLCQAMSAWTGGLAGPGGRARMDVLPNDGKPG